jgi:hypothetical protein
MCSDIPTTKIQCIQIRNSIVKSLEEKWDLNLSRAVERGNKLHPAIHKVACYVLQYSIRSLYRNIRVIGREIPVHIHSYGDDGGP